MPASLKPPKNNAIDFLKTHSSTSNYHIKTIGQFFTYLKDSIISIFNTDHKFAHLGNKSIAKFNFEHMQKDISTFINNPALNNKALKDHKDAITYNFEYNHNQSRILPNTNDIYRSGRIEPNDIITHCINYLNKLDKDELPDDQKQYSSYVTEILKMVFKEKILSITHHS